MQKFAPEVKWGDVEYDDDVSSTTTQGLTMPPAPDVVENRIDAQGVRTIIEYGTNEKGQKIKITKRVKPTKKTMMMNPNVIRRRQWKKFGDCAGVAGIESNVTYTTPDVIHLDLRPKKREEEKDDAGGLEKLSQQTSVVVCRNCGETGHWTLKCPKRNQIEPTNSSNAPTSTPAATAAAPAASTGKYVPVHLRAGATTSSSSQRDDYSVRVTNVSPDTTEADLTELFRKCGHPKRVFLAKDRSTGESRGFAFVSFSDKAEAQRAIDTIDGHGYDNLILRVEWAKPRGEENRAEE
jgi:translation initiation factor 3 subunit G